MGRPTNQDIVVYALYLLGGWQRRVHTEDVAVKAFELAPSEFSWVKYPKYPKLSSVRYALEHAKELDRGTLVEGESEEGKGIGGWMLTASGVQWIKANRSRIERALGEHRPGSRLPAHRRLTALMGSSAFRKYMVERQDADITYPEFAESLVCTVNTGADVLNDRLQQLDATAEELQRQDVKDYIEHCRNKFVSQLLVGGDVK
jgi:hypothetical protein